MTPTEKWVDWNDRQPPEGQIFDSFTNNPNEIVRFKRVGRMLFFYPTMDMYAYYTPKWWKPVAIA